MIPDDLPPESRFGEAISILNRAAHIYLSRRLAQFNLGPGQQAYLLTLSAEQSVTQEAIARRHQVDKANAARAVQALEKLGYVERHPSPTDRRERLVSLSATGVAVRAQVQRILAEWIEELSSTVDAESWQTTVEALSSISAAAMDAARGPAAGDSPDPELGA